MRKRNEILVVCLAIFVSPCAGQSLLAQTVLPDFSQASFSNPLRIDNLYWPMAPGTEWSYEGVSVDPETGESETESTLVQVLNETRVVAGIEARVVRDRVYLEGLLIEDTFDWYAQDDSGNLWYLGEEVTDFEYDDDGNLIGTSHPGQWETGVDGALPGYIMKASPQVGDNYYQEYYVGNAVDEGTVLALGESVMVAAGDFDKTLRILDSSTLFPQFGHKSYAPGVGPVLELDFDESGTQVGRVELVSFVPEPGGVWPLLAGALGLLASRTGRGVNHRRS